MLSWINKKRKRKGFTLVELVVVIAILGILVAIAVPKLAGSRDNASRSAVLANLRTIESAIMMAEADGKTVEGLDDLEDYLQSAPEGPSGATYGVNEEGKAVVNFNKENAFGFKVTTDRSYTLEDLKKVTGEGGNGGGGDGEGGGS